MSNNVEALLAKGLDLHLAYRRAKIRELEVAKVQAAARVQEVLDERNVYIAALVDEEGVSISTIAKTILETTNRHTAYAALKAGRKLRAALAPESFEEEPIEEQERFTWGAEGRTVRINEGDESTVLTVNIDGTFEPADGWDHPLVAAVFGDEMEKAALLEFVKERM